MRYTLGLLLGLTLTGCADAPVASTSSSASSSALASSSAPVFAGSVDESLAMADPGGDAAVDQVIRARQKKIVEYGSNDDRVLLARAWIRKGRETADPGYYLHARACANEVLARAPDDILAMSVLGQVEINEHKFKEALSTSLNVLGRRPQDIISLVNQADALLELGRYEEAVKVGQTLADLKPSLPTYTRASLLSWLHNELPKALESGRLAIESGNDPTDPEPRCYALVQTASFFWHKGDYEGADAGYKRAYDECGDYHYALAGRGRAALAMGKAKEAVEYLEKATNKSQSVEMMWRLGDARSAAGDTAGAEEAYAKVVARGRVEDHRTLVQFYGTKNRDIDEAIKLGREEMKIRPGIYTQDALAWALYRKGELEEARKLSEQALRLKTPDALLEYHLGAILIALGKKEEGKKLVAAALARNPKFDLTGAEEASKLITE